MATKTKIIGWNPKAVLKEMTDNAIALQTERLVEYAKEEIKRLGDMIQTYNSRNHMDRTGNLLNSLCWGVAYDNELKDSGFYREASSVNLSYLHEFSKEIAAYPIDGHKEAEQYIRQYGRLGSGGGTWRVFFAILAPYWGYWEEGFNMKIGGGNSGRPRRIHHIEGLHVMSQFYDKIGKDLKPAKTSIKIHVETYSKTSMQRDYKRRVDNPYSYFNKKWSQDPRSHGNLGSSSRKWVNKRK